MQQSTARKVLPAACAALVASAAFAGAASAQDALGAPDFRDRLVDEYAIEDFCGTGETVDVSERIVGNVWESDTSFVLAFNTTATFTAQNGAQVTDRWAGRIHDSLVEGDDQDGPHTHLITENGLRAFLKTPGGGRVTRDAGTLRYLTEWGEDHEFLGLEILADNGPHPDFDPGGVWCEAAVELLGLGEA